MTRDPARHLADADVPRRGEPEQRGRDTDAERREAALRVRREVGDHLALDTFVRPGYTVPATSPSDGKRV